MPIIWIIRPHVEYIFSIKNFPKFYIRSISDGNQLVNLQTVSTQELWMFVISHFQNKIYVGVQLTCWEINSEVHARTCSAKSFSLLDKLAPHLTSCTLITSIYCEIMTRVDGCCCLGSPLPPPCWARRTTKDSLGNASVKMSIEKFVPT